MKVYIAAPFFNAEQRSIVTRIEMLLTRYGYDYYSPRLHSGSDKLTPEQRKDQSKWLPILQSNIDQLDECDILLAVVEYAMPTGISLRPVTISVSYPPREHIGDKAIELPDNGVVWECGYWYTTGKPAIGFHSTKPISELNLMLSHTLTGFVTGFTQLEDVFQSQPGMRGGMPNFNALQHFKGDVI